MTRSAGLSRTVDVLKGDQESRGHCCSLSTVVEAFTQPLDGGCRPSLALGYGIQARCSIAAFEAWACHRDFAETSFIRRVYEVLHNRGGQQGVAIL